jgi:hypothetical protein
MSARGLGFIHPRDEEPRLPACVFVRMTQVSGARSVFVNGPRADTFEPLFQNRLQKEYTALDW